jgi:NADH-quinone oxidoreductase subunit D
MSTKLRRVVYNVSRNPELSSGGSLVHAPIVPVTGEESRLNEDIAGEHMLINIGPQHPATHGVLRLVLELDGETVVRCIPHIGYLHSSFEKLGEYRDWNQIVPLTDRMDYLAPLIYNCAYAMSVEKLMGVEVTERCKVVRLICMELDRIFSHLPLAGDHGHRPGCLHRLPVHLPAARADLRPARVVHRRADHHLVHPHRGDDGGPAGGVDRPARQVDRRVPPVLDEVDTLLTNNGIWIGRTQGVGSISAADAVNWGLSGPNLRASGCRTTCARTARTTTWTRTTSTCRWASTATSTTATCAAWRR